MVNGHQMIQEDKLELFWNFIYGIEELSVPEKGGAHHRIAREILGAVDATVDSWKINDITIDDSLKKGSKIKGFIKFQTTDESIAGHIKDGKLTIKTFNAILCYFFFSLSRDYENPKQIIPYLKNLIDFFDTLDPKSFPKKSIRHTYAFINHLLKKVKLIGIRPDILPNLKLSFYQFNNQGVEIELFKNQDNKNFEEHLLEDYKDVALYKQKLRDEFKEICVGFDGFPIPIDDVIELPFFIINKRVEENKELLKKELELERNIENDQDLILIKQLEEEITKIDLFLNKKHRPFDILSNQQDIFILSPAGSGKTTLLKWIAYKLTHQDGQLPIFIELQSYDSDLLALIEYNLKRFKLSFEVIQSRPLILLIDGFDEYSGKEESILIREIRDFKRGFNCQIIFTGRNKPIGIGEKEFITYKLSEFSSQNIEQVLKNVFPSKGDSYYTKLYNANLLEYLNTPLYLIFLLSHLKKQDRFEITEITKLLKNKGVLLNTVLVEDFLNNYEYQKKLQYTKHKWYDIKSKQIELIAFLAYHLTFEQNNKENISRDEAVLSLKSHIKQTSKSEIKFKNIDIEELLEDFKNHSILSFKRHKVGFDKKEIRLFFSARHIIQYIETYEDYKKYKKLFNGDTNSWDSIEIYLFGLIEPSKIMENITSYFINDTIIYSNSSISQVDLALKFIKSGNTNSNYHLLDKIYFLNFIAFIFINDLIFERNTSNKKNNIYYEFVFYFVRTASKIGRILKKRLSEFHIDLMNYRYFHYLPITGNRDTSISGIEELSKVINSNLSKNHFKDVKINRNTFKKLSISTDSKAKGVSINLINNQPNFIFSLCYVLIFTNYFNYKKTRKIINNYNYQQKKISWYLIDFLKLYSNEFLDYYFTLYNSPTALNIKTLFMFYKNNSLFIKSNRLLPETTEKIMNCFHFFAKKYNKLNGLSIKVSNFIEGNLDETIINNLMNTWGKEIRSNSITLEVKQAIVGIYSRLTPIEDTELFIELLDINDEKIGISSTWVLLNNYSRIKGEEQELKNKIMNTLKQKFLASKTDISIKLTIISYFSRYNIKPPEGFLNEIIEFASSGTTHYFTVINFFGNLQIERATPYILSLLSESSILSQWAYYALFKIDCKNHYSYEYAISLKKMILEDELNDILNEESCLSEINNLLLDKCKYLGDQQILETLEKIYTSKRKTHDYSYPLLKNLKSTIEYLKQKVIKLQECESHQKKSSDNKISED